MGSFLVFGRGREATTRVVRLKGGLNAENVKKQAMTGELFKGVIGHRLIKPSLIKANEILASRQVLPSGTYLQDVNKHQLSAPLEVMTPEVEVTAPEVVRKPSLKLEIVKVVKYNGQDRFGKVQISVGLFKQIMGDYKLQSSNVSEFQAVLDDPSRREEGLTEHAEPVDVKAFVDKLCEVTGEQFAVLISAS